MKTALRQRLVSFGLSLVLLALTRRASAETARVLFISPEKTPFSTRIQAEIEAMGIEVVPTDALDQNNELPIGAAARVIETPPPQRIELWLRTRSRVGLSSIESW